MHTDDDSIPITRGTITMQLASTLAQAGMDAALAMNCATDCVQEGRTPHRWREVLGTEAADALDMDLADNLAKAQT